MDLTLADFENYIAKYSEHLALERNLSPKSINAYFYDLRMLLNWSHAHSCEIISETSLQAYFSELVNHSSLKDTSIKRKYISIKSFYNFLLEKEWIAHSPVTKLGKNFKKAKRIPKTLSIEEIQKLLASPQNDYHTLASEFRKRICIRNNAIMELLFSTGIRIGELVNISLNDLDLEKQTLLIFGKGRKERLLYLSSEEVIVKIKNWLDQREHLHPKCDSLFINKYGNTLTIYSIEDIFYKYRKAANINANATPHYLRHSFATQLLDNGADLRSVQEILGHSSVSTTEIYTEVSIQRKKDVLSRFNPRNYLQV
jgi:integrase/recombinase XerD